MSPLTQPKSAARHLRPAKAARENVIDISRMAEPYKTRRRQRLIATARDFPTAFSEEIKVYSVGVALPRFEDFPDIEVLEVADTDADQGLRRLLGRAETKQLLMFASMALMGLLFAIILGAPRAALLSGVALAFTGGAALAIVHAARRASPLSTVLLILVGGLLFYEIIDLFAHFLR